MLFSRKAWEIENLLFFLLTLVTREGLELLLRVGLSLTGRHRVRIYRWDEKNRGFGRNWHKVGAGQGGRGERGPAYIDGGKQEREQRY